jgi:integrase
MYKRAGVYWACIRHNGKKIQKSLGTSNKTSARKIENKIREQINDGKYFERLAGYNKTFRDTMERFMKEHAPTVSISMQESYITSLKHLDLFFGSSSLLSITPKMLSRYKVLRRKAGSAPGSINKELAMLSKAFSLAITEWEWLKDNPVSKVPREKENNEIDRWLTKDEEERLLVNSPEWLRELISFALNSGLRQDELLSLEWNRVDLFRKTIIIQETKNGKPKTLPTNTIALGVLNQRLKVKG